MVISAMTTIWNIFLQSDSGIDLSPGNMFCMIFYNAKQSGI